ncbi:MAG: helix-turn-helix transcriptional regulator [Pirellulaceae bacterium]|nr:helix-turn-helix transcriptional regulator [Planctomycetales bacterium]
MNVNKKPTSERVYRDLTADERTRLEVARAETEAKKDRLVAEGKLRKKAWAATRREVQRTVAALKAERERAGLSLADVESRSGLKRSALSRLENDPDANPTLLTLQRYAAPLKMTLATTLEPSR